MKETNCLKWKYKIVVFNSLHPLSEAQLNSLGQEGWELIQILFHPDRVSTVIFSQPIEEEETE